MSDRNLIEEFEQERLSQVGTYHSNTAMMESRDRWLEQAFSQRFMYNFDWMGRPIIQMPADIVGWQEVLWQDKPDLVIETGIAHGGSLILSASVLALLDLFDGNPRGTRRVLGVDIDIREHNRREIESHPLAVNIDMIEGPSTSPEVLAEVRKRASVASRISVALDSNHTHDHVMDELRNYASLVSPDLHCVVFDTIVEYLPEEVFPDRTWAPGNSPASALEEYLSQPGIQTDDDGRSVVFERSEWFNNKLLASAAPGGFIRRTVA